MVRAYIGLGANQGDPVAQLRSALTALARVPQTHLVACSSFYRSAPMGDVPQDDYINAVAALDTVLAPEALLDALQAIEQAHGRVRGPLRWGPRTLDLDMLTFGDRRIENARLQVPHPGIIAREFVLYPLYEIAPEFDIVGLGPVATLMRECPRRGLQRLELAV